MPKKLEESLKKEAKEKGLTGEQFLSLLSLILIGLLIMNLLEYLSKSQGSFKLPESFEFPEPKGKTPLSLIEEAQRRNPELPPGLLMSIAIQETGGEKDPSTAISRSNAKGLFQQTPVFTAQYGVKDPTDPEQAIEGVVKALRHNLKVFEGDLPKAVAAYSAGTRAVAERGLEGIKEENRNYYSEVLRRLASETSSGTRQPSEAFKRYLSTPLKRGI